MKELFMFYLIRNIVWLVLFCMLIVNAKDSFAQGVVSLSEEAMFDDELETNKDFPSAPVVAPKPEIKTASQPVADQTDSAPADNTDFASADNTDSVSTDAVNGINDLPNLAVTSKKASDEFAAAENSVVIQPSPNTKVDDLFSQMSDIERNTALLNLQLRREKLQNEIEAVKNQRKQALEQEKQKAEELKQKMLEKSQEEERKKREEMQRLRELDITFEKLRQEKILKAYKNQMLEEAQKWIAHDAMFYKTIDDLRQENKSLSDNYKEKMIKLKNEADSAYTAYTNKLEDHRNEITNLNSQIDVLRSRIASLEQEIEERSRNPFAQEDSSQSYATTTSSETTSTQGEVTSSVSEPISNPLAKYYAVTEIRGQGGELIAKLVNKNGLGFYVKKGTALQSGHVVSEITSTYVAADKNFKKDYIYFSAGGILPEEVDAFEIGGADDEEEE